MDTSPTMQASLCPAQTTADDDLDEPPELHMHHPQPHRFQRTIVRRPSQKHSSLLTKAIQAQEDHDLGEATCSILANTNNHRRRSMTSNISIASTADLTSDTGFTSPSRTNTPSPPIPEMAMLRLNQAGFLISPSALVQPTAQVDAPVHVHDATTTDIPKEAPRKRCIQFACAKPQRDAPTNPPSTLHSTKLPANTGSRRPSIRFACPSRPTEAPSTPPKSAESAAPPFASFSPPDSSSTPKRTSTLSATLAASPPTVRRLNRPQMARPRFLRANSKDLAQDSSQFHEFACDVSHEDDWIRHDNSSVTGTKLTINDTLVKEIGFRRLADEAEQEALEEEEDDKNDTSDEDDDEEDADDGDDSQDDDDQDDDRDLDYIAGYSTDEETGFADSDEDDDDDDDMVLWTPGQANANSSCTPLARRLATDQLSDSSTISQRSDRVTRRTKPRKIHSDHQAHDLPDSTDFVCGTLDEDRPLEEAYLSCLAARRMEKLRIIPQDIDPSFPTSDPEIDDDDGVGYISEDTTWTPAKMDDARPLDRSRRHTRTEQASPRKYHSPPPKRRLSPAPRPRPRSPAPLFDRRSPHRMHSPAPRALTTPLQSPRQGKPARFKLAGRPDVTHTKSLPRPAALFRSRSHRVARKQDDEIHVRGAIDIVKGLEKKRQRRREKFNQKYCHKARRGQIPERKTQPGRGAERMRELGLLMAGKKDPGNYVLSV